MGKRSGPAERLLQLLAGRWVPGAGELGVRRRARTEERARSSGTCKRTQRRDARTQPARRAGACAEQGKEPGCALGPHLAPAPGVEAPTGSCPGGGGPHWGPMSQQPAMH